MGVASQNSTLPSAIIRCPVSYVVANPVRGLLDRKRSDEHLPSSNESKIKTQTHKNDKEKGTGITKYTGQKKIDEEHSIARVCHSASREPSDTLPGSQPCTQKRVASTTFRTLKGFQFSLTAQSTSLRESLGWPNQRGSKTSQACYSHPRCNLNLVRLFRFSLLLPLIGRIFFFPHPRGHKPTTPFLYRV